MNKIQIGGVIAAVFAIIHSAEAAFVVADFANDPRAEINQWENFTAFPGVVPADQPDTPGAWPHLPDFLSESLNAGAPAQYQIGMPTITPVGDSFYTSGGNIYSFSAAKTYELADAPNLVGEGSGLVVWKVYFQVKSFGNEFDYNGIRLNFDNGSGVQSVAATFSEDIDRIVFDGEFGGVEVVHRWGWELNPADNITNYTITWEDAESSVSFVSARLETLAVEAVNVPEPSALLLIALGGLSLCWRRRR